MEITTNGRFDSFKFDNAHPEEVKKFMGQMKSQFGGGPPRCPPAAPPQATTGLVKSAEVDSKISLDKMKAESEKKEA